MLHRNFLTLSIWLGLTGVVHADTEFSFEKDVRPILKTYCLDCHGAHEKLSGDLDLRLTRFMLDGGNSGPAIVAKQPQQSLLLQRLKSGEMPPGEKKVPPEQIAILERWIASGARTLREEPKSLPPGLGITAEERAYWFYQPLTQPTPPSVEGTPNLHPVDAFILKKLREQGLSLNPEASRRTLILRATFDLTGLPPSQKEIDTFLADSSPRAYEVLLDRLLSSPAYGERWGRHWLDVAGYADSEGDGTTDTVRPHAWRYRDYVVRALNADRPLNQFIVEQLAGDELVPRPWSNLTPDQVELLAATGFLRCAPDGTATGATDAEQVMVDTLKVVSSSLLGSSVGCAQCHDHRYDPIPQADYFQLRAIFEPALDPKQWRKPAQRLVSLYADADRKQAAAIEAEAAKMQTAFTKTQLGAVQAAFEKELEKFPADMRDDLQAAFQTEAAKRTPAQQKLVASNPKLNITPGVLYQYNPKVADELKALQAKIVAKRAERPAEGFVAVATEVPGRVPTTQLHYRGDARQPIGPNLVAADLTIAAEDGKRFTIPTTTQSNQTSGRRLAWARHLTSGDHPLFGRVMANRIWMHHFGRGIVETPGEFGQLGQRPSHPELLDWLAAELPRQKWSLKAIHKLIMTSRVYRQSSNHDTKKDTVDTGNTLLGRFPVRRLEAEAIRDRILQTVGRLDRTMFGPAVTVVEDATGQASTPDNQPRRSLYLQVRRTKPVAFLSAFDAPVLEPNCDRRASTTTAPQSLMLLNSEFIRTQAGHMATRVRQAHATQPTPEQLVQTAWQLAYFRPATDKEVRLATQFLKTQSQALEKKSKNAEHAVLTNLCHQLLASNEFLYVD